MADISQLPDISAIYFVLDGSGRVLYVGASKTLRRRWNDHHRRKDLDRHGAASVEWYEVEPLLLADEEQRAIATSAPLLNHKSRYFLRTARPRNGKESEGEICSCDSFILHGGFCGRGVLCLVANENEYRDVRDSSPCGDLQSRSTCWDLCINWSTVRSVAVDEGAGVTQVSG